MKVSFKDMRTEIAAFRARSSQGHDGRRTRIIFPEQLKVAVVGLYRDSGLSVSEVSRQLDIRDSVLGNWLKAFPAVQPMLGDKPASAAPTSQFIPINILEPSTPPRKLEAERRPIVVSVRETTFTLPSIDPVTLTKLLSCIRGSEVC